MALSPSWDTQNDAELIINARQTTDVTIRTNSTTDIVTVHENWSLHYGFPFNMRTTADIEEKGNLSLTDQVLVLLSELSTLTLTNNENFFAIWTGNHSKWQLMNDECMLPVQTMLFRHVHWLKAMSDQCSNCVKPHVVNQSRCRQVESCIRPWLGNLWTTEPNRPTNTIDIVF